MARSSSFCGKRSFLWWTPTRIGTPASRCATCRGTPCRGPWLGRAKDLKATDRAAARVPNLSAAARSVGLRPATASDLCTGKIPIGRAEVRMLVGLAALASCSLDDLVVRGGLTGMLETGIKPVDLLAPLVRGGVAGLIARPGVGQLVLLAELCRTPSLQRGFAT